MEKYWHFAAINDNGQPIMRDGTLIEIGKRYEIEGEPELCARGYHGSLRAIDALKYAPGAWVSLRPLDGVIEGDDKAVGKSFMQQKGADATEVLREFARLCALDVVHMWDAHQVVIDYLKTGDKSLRDAVIDASKNCAWNPTMAATWNAAMAAESDAAWSAASAIAVDVAKEKQNQRLEKMLHALLEEK